MQVCTFFFKEGQEKNENFYYTPRFHFYMRRTSADCVIVFFIRAHTPVRLSKFSGV